MPVIESLATLAYEGRRRDFAEEQLIAALRILQAGDVDPAHMRGSWAGAMGHTQFIPTSYLSYAVDFTGDGRRDIWSDDPTDALASTANYLARSGWTRGQPWGVEVRLPEGFNYGSADQSNIRPVADWRARGVTLVNGAAAARPRLGGDHRRRPAPAARPSPSTTTSSSSRNTTTPPPTRWASATSATGSWAAAALRRRSWPRGERELSRTEKIELQKRLIARGYDTGSTDGVIGPDTSPPIRAFQARAGPDARRLRHRAAPRQRLR